MQKMTERGNSICITISYCYHRNQIVSSTPSKRSKGYSNRSKSRRKKSPLAHPRRLIPRGEAGIPGRFSLIGTVQAQKTESRKACISRETQELVGLCSDHGPPARDQKGHNLGTVGNLPKERNHCI